VLDANEAIGHERAPEIRAALGEVEAVVASSERVLRRADAVDAVEAVIPAVEASLTGGTRAGEQHAGSRVALTPRSVHALSVLAAWSAERR
jgi:hypothetical protein